MSRTRHGVALIIAISVLAALLFLALPFLFSQTASLAGATSTSRGERANRGLGTAEQMATALAVYANGFHLAPGQAIPALGDLRNASDLQAELLGPLVQAVGQEEGLRHVMLDYVASRPSSVLGQSLVGPSAPLVGSTISDNSLGATVSDEEAKLDPNSLNVVGWARLFEILEIQDPKLQPWVWDDPTKPGSVPWPDRGKCDPVEAKYGLLACAMIWLRESSPGNRFVSLDDLARADLADPGVYAQVRTFMLSRHWLVPEDPTGNASTGAPTVPRSTILDAILAEYPRRNAGLLRSEIVRLSGYLTTMVPGRSRGGAIDVGSVIQHVNGIHGEQWRLDLLQRGTSRYNWLRHFSNNTGAPVYEDSNGALHIGSTAFLKPFESVLDLGVAVEPGVAFAGMHEVPSLDWFNIRDGSGRERSAVSPASMGIITISAAAQASDRRGASETGRARRITIQAVPQELPVVSRWVSQAECEALVRSGHSSWMQSAPKPAGRVLALPHNDNATPYSFKDPGWIEQAPISFYGESMNSSSLSLQWNPTWHASLGQRTPAAMSDVLKAGTNDDLPLSMTAAGTAPGVLLDLMSQGLAVPTGGIGWPLYNNATGPLSFADRGVGGDQMDGRRVALWMEFASTPSDGAVILESRRDGANDRNLWQVIYRNTPVPYLTLVIANAAKPWLTNSSYRMGKDDPATPELDEGSKAAAGDLPLAPADPASRVEFRYRLAGPLEKDRWYHLQVLCGGDRPGSHLLILDGIVGGDALISGSFANPGDHYTFPSLRLDQDIPFVQPSAITGTSLVMSADVSLLAPPAFSGGGRMALDQVLPKRGLVRIDDEWFRYEGLTSTTLTGVTRGRRQNTNMELSGVLVAGDPSVDNQRSWPLVQGHKTNALVTPGWTQLELHGASGRWLFGDCTLKQALPATTDPLYQKLCPDDVMTWTAASATNAGPPLSFSLSSDEGWPERGYCWILASDGGNASGGALMYYQHGAFVRSGTTVTMDFLLPNGDDDPLAYGGLLAQGTQTNPSAAVPTVVYACPTSIEVDGDVAPLPDDRYRFTSYTLDLIGSDHGETSYEVSYSYGGAVQLLDATGGAEWLYYHAISDRGPAQSGMAGGHVTGRFLLHLNNFRPPKLNPTVQNRPRGIMRTQSPAWSASTAASVVKVLPVQNLLSNTDRWESGDVVTIIPKDASDPAQADPPQLVVRLAARDGFPTTRASAGKDYDTKNEWFAFDRAVPLTLRDPSPPPTTPPAYLMVSGRGWGGRDLSQISHDQFRRGFMPSWSGLAGTATARLAILSPDNERGGTGPAITAAEPPMLDDIQAGILEGHGDANAAEKPEVITGFFAVTAGSGPGLETPGAELAELTASTSDLPVIVSAGSTGLFIRDLGLVYIDGEVFAYRRCRIANPTTPVTYGSSAHLAVLIARGQLGSTSAAHRVPPSTDAPNPNNAGLMRPGLPALHLHIGPVAELSGTLSETAAADSTAVDLIDRPRDDYDAITFAANRYASGTHGHSTNLEAAPYHLISAADGSAVEVTRFIQISYSKQVTVAPWLRGMYGTTAKTWTPTNGLNPIVIGWYPRFAPPLPSTLPSGSLGTQNQKDAILRSRSFAWGGFPMRYVGMRCAGPTLSAATSALSLAGGPAEITADGAPSLSFTARALTAKDTRESTFLWSNAPSVSLSNSTSSSSAAAAFTGALFNNRELDGVEVRVHWTATTPPAIPTLSTIAERQGLMARIGPVTLRCMAPVRILGVEGTR